MLTQLTFFTITLLITAILFMAFLIIEKLAETVENILSYVF